MYCRWQTPPLRDTMDVWGRWAGRGIVMVWEKRRCDVAEMEEKVESSSYQHQHYHQPLRTQWLDYLRAHASCCSCACSAWLLLHQHHHQHTLITLTLFVLLLWSQDVSEESMLPSQPLHLCSYTCTILPYQCYLWAEIGLHSLLGHKKYALFLFPLPHLLFSFCLSTSSTSLFDVLILCKSCLTSFDYDQWLKMVNESQRESKRVKESQRESKRVKEVKEVKESQQTEGKSWTTVISLHSFFKIFSMFCSGST